MAFFPRTDAGQFSINLKAPTGTRIEVSEQYVARVEIRRDIATEYPELRAFFSSGSTVDAVLNMGTPAPIDVQFSSPNLDQAYQTAKEFAERIGNLPGVSQAYIPQDMNYPAVRLDVGACHYRWSDGFRDSDRVYSSGRLLVGVQPTALAIR